jgi:hypothetical protein
MTMLMMFGRIADLLIERPLRKVETVEVSEELGFGLLKTSGQERAELFSCTQTMRVSYQDERCGLSELIGF